MFLVTFSNAAEKFLRRADAKLPARLKLLFDTLATEPVPAREFDIRKINGMQDSYRIRLSSYRVPYAVDWTEKRISIFDIERRDEKTYG